ncbi:hypothetical protein Tco_1355441 [Tanacetum coccineum]
MKGLKSKLKALSWKNGNLHEIVEKCKINLKEAQSNVDKNPHCHDIKKKETVALAEYNKAINDEEEFLYQKAKVEWISKDIDKVLTKRLLMVQSVKSREAVQEEEKIPLGRNGLICGLNSKGKNIWEISGKKTMICWMCGKHYMILKEIWMYFKKKWKLPGLSDRWDDFGGAVKNSVNVQKVAKN